MSSLANNYNRRKISFKYGKGSFLYSTKGKKYLDFVQGIAVNSLGHANPHLVKALNKQSKKVWHVSNAFQIPEAEKLARMLTKWTKHGFSVVGIVNGIASDPTNELQSRSPSSESQSPISSTGLSTTRWVVSRGLRRASAAAAPS